MGQLSGFTYRDIVQRLKFFGFSFLRQAAGSHEIWHNKTTGRHSIYQRGEYKTEVPRHNEIVDELARKICKDLKIPFMRWNDEIQGRNKKIR